MTHSPGPKRTTAPRAPERATAAVRALRYRVTKDGRLLAGTTDEAKAHSLAQLLGGVVETGRRAP